MVVELVEASKRPQEKPTKLMASTGSAIESLKKILVSYQQILRVECGR